MLYGTEIVSCLGGSVHSPISASRPMPAPFSNPDEPEPNKAKESTGVRRQAKPQAKNGIGTFQSTEEFPFPKSLICPEGPSSP